MMVANDRLVVAEETLVQERCANGGGILQRIVRSQIAIITVIIILLLGAIREAKAGSIVSEDQSGGAAPTKRLGEFRHGGKQ